MRTGISIALSTSDRRELEAIVDNRDSPQKHVWRAAIVLLSAEDVGTHEIMRHRHVQDLRVALAGAFFAGGGGRSAA